MRPPKRARPNGPGDAKGLAAKKSGPEVTQGRMEVHHGSWLDRDAPQDTLTYVTD